MAQARIAVKLSTLLINDMLDLCVLYIKREDISTSLSNLDNKHKEEYGDKRQSMQSRNTGHSRSQSKKSHGHSRNNPSFSQFLSQ